MSKDGDLRHQLHYGARRFVSYVIGFRITSPSFSHKPFSKLLRARLKLIVAAQYALRFTMLFVSHSSPSSSPSSPFSSFASYSCKRLLFLGWRASRSRFLFRVDGCFASWLHFLASSYLLCCACVRFFLSSSCMRFFLRPPARNGQQQTRKSFSPSALPVSSPSPAT